VLIDAVAALSHHLEDEFVQAALLSGMDLREYSKGIEKELKTVERDAVKDYIQQADQLAALHQEISSCDKVLEVSKNSALAAFLFN
jgi:hypothetical protein